MPRGEPRTLSPFLLGKVHAQHYFAPVQIPKACSGVRGLFAAVAALTFVGIVAAALAQTPSLSQARLREQLKALPYRIAHECYTNDNWEIFTCNADGSDPRNLTQTPKQHEHYPQVSPDGTKLCFSVDEGEGREAVRSLWVMGIDGSNRRKLVEQAREPFWRPDGEAIGYLPQEFSKFNVVDFFTRGMSFYELSTGKVESHVNNGNLLHLYNPSWAVSGKWIVATVHAGLKVDHGILLIEAAGDNIINLKIPGCRPCFSPDGRKLAWGSSDHEIAIGSLNMGSGQPFVSDWRVCAKDPTNKIYHVDWSPDGRFLSFSRGPDGEGNVSKPGTFQAACEMVGVYAARWDLCVVPAEVEGVVDFNNPAEGRFVMITTNGCSNKEPAWFRARRGAPDSR